MLELGGVDAASNLIITNVQFVSPAASTVAVDSKFTLSGLEKRKYNSNNQNTVNKAIGNFCAVLSTS